MLICYCKPETASDMRISDWSSAVCSSDLAVSALERRLRFPTSEADPGPSGGRGVVAMSDLGKTCGRGAQHRTTMDFLLLAWFGKPLWLWLGFLAVIIALLDFDLGVLHRKDHEIAMRESLLLSAFYITLGLAFGETGSASRRERVCR